METMGISHFKSHALKILDKVAKTHETIVITKRGLPEKESKRGGMKFIPPLFGNFLLYI